MNKHDRPSLCLGRSVATIAFCWNFPFAKSRAKIRLFFFFLCLLSVLYWDAPVWNSLSNIWNSPVLSYLTSNWATAIVLFVLVCRHLNCEVHPGLSKWVWSGWAGIGLLIIQVKSLQPIDAGIFHMKFQLYATYSLPHSPQSHILKCKLVNHPLPRPLTVEPTYRGKAQKKKKVLIKIREEKSFSFLFP